ncbi:MAG: hypothetical protein QXP04_01715 [Candidatus Nanoarchaeia archaeon]|nr:hypothetical protein [Candidatus Jingweiarchaeum tengchongense]
MKQKPNYIIEGLENKRIEITTKFFGKNCYYIYRGPLDKKEVDFLYMSDCEVVKIINGKEVERKNIDRIALSKSIVSWIRF